MAKYRTIKIRNGDMWVPYIIYTCVRCGEDVEEAWPSVRCENGDVYCMDCGFIEGLITSEQYVQRCPIGLPGLRAACHDGEIHLTTGKYFPWERPSNRRNEKAYTDWRTAVFERDKYTCQQCGKVGGKLNAHHIKPYKTHKSQRLKIDNGLTLCKECHKAEHRKKGATDEQGSGNTILHG